MGCHAAASLATLVVTSGCGARVVTAETSTDDGARDAGSYDAHLDTRPDSSRVDGSLSDALGDLSHDADTPPGPVAIPAVHCVWGKQFGDDLQGWAQYFASAANDPSGSVILAGQLAKGSLDFGGGSIQARANSLDDVFVVKLDALGHHVWTRQFGVGSSQIVEAVATDAAGDVLLAGIVSGEIDFGGGPLSSVGNDGVFLAKLDPTGAHLWSHVFPAFEVTTPLASPWTRRETYCSPAPSAVQSISETGR